MKRIHNFPMVVPHKQDDENYTPMQNSGTVFESKAGPALTKIWNGVFSKNLLDPIDENLKDEVLLEKGIS
jgi:hypothetical protein